MTEKRNYRLATLAVRGGYASDCSGSVNMPIYTSTAWNFNDADHAADLFDLKVAGNIYTRITNPTMDAFAERVNLLDGGSGALAVSSGQAAITLAVTNICKAGDHFISTSTLYGGTYTLFSNTLKNYGIEVSFVDPALSYEELKKYIRKNTRCIYGETIGNPQMNVLDFEKFSKLAKEAEIPLVIDNTFPTPALFKPKEHGANIVVYSATKYIGGHGNALGGVIVDLGNFDWDNGKYPGLTELDPSYHGIKYTEAFGSSAYIMKARVQVLRDLGSCLSPFNSWVLSMGMETLPLRMKQHSKNALALAEYLENHPKIAWVSYPLLKSNLSYDLARKHLPDGASGMLAFGVIGGLNAGKLLVNSIELSNLVANLGDTRTLVAHPASTTHSQLSETDQAKAGVMPDMIRVSVGIEDIDDIIYDFEEALKNI